MNAIARLLPLGVLAMLSACTYGIRLDPGGEHVRTVWDGNTGIRACRDVGKVTVSVLSRIGPIDRNDIKVRDELEIMARNQAAPMHADTITPLGDPHDGEQSWEAWDCGNVPPPAAQPSVASGSGAPVEDVPGNAPSPNAPPSGQQPAPFSAPAPASTASAQTYPISGGTD